MMADIYRSGRKYSDCSNSGPLRKHVRILLCQYNVLFMFQANASYRHNLSFKIKGIICYLCLDLSNKSKAIKLQSFHCPKKDFSLGWGGFFKDCSPRTN